MPKRLLVIIALSAFLIVALFGISRIYYVINPVLCDMCGHCMMHCPNNAIYFDEGQMTMRIDSELCDGCGECLNWCVHTER